MKKKGLIILAVLFLNISFAQQDTFNDGEWFKFKMSYSGFLKAGNASLTVNETTLNGKPVYHVLGKGWTTGPLRWFFKVKDRYETYMNINTLAPQKFVRNINEGGYTKNIEINFNHEESKAYVNDIKHNRKSEHKTDPNIFDMVSAYYYLRHIVDIDDLQPNREYSISMFFDESNYGFKLKYIGKEIIETEVGKIDALKFRPYVMAGRIFKEEESLTLWVSNDKNKLPLRIKADLAVGSLRADLEAFKGLKHPFKIVVEN